MVLIEISEYALDDTGMPCFRPLAGIMVLIWLEDLYPMINDRVSFRPLAGIMVLIERMILYAHEKIKVSVPLRGLWFLSEGRRNHEKGRHNKFPSPCGDYGSYQVASLT